MQKISKNIILVYITLFIISCSQKVPKTARNIEDFNKDWTFSLDSTTLGIEKPNFDDSKWRKIKLPHDWSIEGNFDEKNPAGYGGGALPGGIGWYRKIFTVPESARGKAVFIDFDGIYKNSEVWINGTYLGKRPNGYISFRYELTPYLGYGAQKNVIVVKADNSKQPYSRWYSGSGIYRNVWLTTTDKIHVDYMGTYITNPEVSEASASVLVKTTLKNDSEVDQKIKLKTILYDAEGKEVSQTSSENILAKGAKMEYAQNLKLDKPNLWSIESPYLYKALSLVEKDGQVVDSYETTFGIRFFEFDKDKGFSLNGKNIKIKGVCNHHDLGCLGAAVNTRAMERQLEIMKKMGVNGIRTTHNPPAPELLDLCDRMGFIVMDEAFDMWKKKKTDFDYHLDWDQWHKRDLEDQILRDRNHPSVFLWSIGNEVSEQWGGDTTAGIIAKELAAIVKNLDKTRPITAACNEVTKSNTLISSGALDIIGTNYSHEKIDTLQKMFPGQKFIGTETNSSLMTRGQYDFPADSIRLWPARWDLPVQNANTDLTCSSFDNCKAPWGATHDEMWKITQKNAYFSGMYIWTGFDYLGEPTPYRWPARSSYFGIVDLAGFPKDAFYFYQSQWTTQPVLHLLPHWNWSEGQTLDVWAYYNNADEVELFINGISQGIHKANKDHLHAAWKVKYQAGELKAISRKGGKEVLSTSRFTARKAAKIVLEADRSTIKADGKDLSFITVKVVDKEGNLVPNADNLVSFSTEGAGALIAVDNGAQASMESFKASFRKAYKGLCLAVLQSQESAGKITLKASAEGLEGATIEVSTK